MSNGAKDAAILNAARRKLRETAGQPLRAYLMRSVASLTPNPRNARTHSKKQIRQIAKSIEQFGFTSPILIDEQGVVLAGHGRLQAARMLGMLEVPTITIAHLSEIQKRLVLLNDNKIAQNAGWDREILALELGDLAIALPEMDLSLDITGFSTGEIDSIHNDHGSSREPADEVDFSAKPIVTRPGDVWQCGVGRKHRVACGDARQPDVLAKLHGDALPCDMVMTDPPYNVHVNGHVGGRGKRRHEEFACASGEMSPEEYRVFLTTTIDHMVSATRLGGLIYVFIDWRHVEDVLQVCRGLGLLLRNICIWSKTTPGQGSFYRSAHEMIVVLQVPGGEATNNIQLGRNDRNRTNVWSYPGVNTFQVGKDADLTVHPTVKPVSMIAEAIKDASPRSGIVLDPFLGSGTTLLACEKVGRTCHGLEYEPRYVDVAIRRWQQFTSQDAILVNSANELNARDDEVGEQPDTIRTSLHGLTFDEVAQARRGVSEVPDGPAPGQRAGVPTTDGGAQ